MSVAEGETIYFLDTSALAKLYHQEQGSEMVERWAADHTIRLWLSVSMKIFAAVFALCCLRMTS
jgi:predicted nucleic acid-binding protein